MKTISSTSTLFSEVLEIRVRSDLAWEMAADTARDQDAVSKFISAWDNWEEAWDAAEDAIRAGHYDRALELLKECQHLENESGDDSFARKAIALVEAAL